MFYRLFLLQIKNVNIDVKAKDKKVLLYIDNVLKYTFSNFKCVLDEISFENKKLFFKFYLLTPIFDYIDSYVIVKYKDKEKRIKIKSEEYFNNEVLKDTNIFYFEGDTSFDYNNELEMYLVIDKERFMLIPTFKNKSSKYIYDNDYLYQIVNNRLYVTYSSIINKFKLYSKRIIKKIGNRGR